MNIIFLDIDGVVVSHSSATALGLAWAQDDPAAVHLNPVAVGMLKEALSCCDSFGKEVVLYIHSDWSHRGIDWFKKLFECYRFMPDMVTGCHDVSQSRVERIRCGLNYYQPEKFLVIDDSPECQVFGKDHLQTDPRDGFLWRDYETTVRHFGAKPTLMVM